MTTEQIIKTIKNVGQSIIDNAESIAGDYRYQTELNIDISIPVTGTVARVDVSTSFVPEKEMEDKTIGGYRN